jgi:hypothetical protein
VFNEKLGWLRCIISQKKTAPFSTVIARSGDRVAGKETIFFDGGRLGCNIFLSLGDWQSSIISTGF